ncbi:uncharacterized protein LOC105838967 [Monomorium pharaonis]|uniref:uncharacterized protein LOC105838967 n=1 Tax=Monomorium pharaonis TaxID=307658 RepID=UPI00063F91D5|nr:uncharacterized protein LOC105838967 [Monomorium pharaonis]
MLISVKLKYCFRLHGSLNIAVMLKMQSARPFIMCIQISRCICLSSTCLNISKQGKFMRKIMYGSRKPKRKWYDTSTDLRNIASVNPTDKSPSMHTKRRMMIRDKLFMEHITDMVSMGEVSDIIKGGIEITHVKITPDFKCVNVFYIPSNDSSVDQEALQKCAGIIRHELSQLRVIGIVPPIQFVQNRQYFIQKEVDRRLAMLKFEEDSEILSEQLNISEPDNVDQTLHEESNNTVHDCETDRIYIQLPVMRHDVLGLDHHKIMSRISIAVSKSKKAAQKRILDTNIDTNESTHNPKEVVEKFLTREEQQKIFSDFLNKRRIEEKRKYSLKRLNKQKLLNNFEEEIYNGEDYEDNDDIKDNIDEYNFEDETRK